MRNVREILKKRPLLFDGGMGTYYKSKPGQECEQANLTDPEGVLAVHREYLAAGADAIKTNTFGLPRMAAAHTPGWEALAEAGWKLAEAAAAPAGAFVFADLGPAPDTEALPAAQALATSIAEMYLPCAFVMDCSLATRYVVAVGCISELLFFSAVVLLFFIAASVVNAISGTSRFDTGQIMKLLTTTLGFTALYAVLDYFLV